ncbi:MAG: response regulator, partial [Myxococcota bacterium]
MSPIRVLVVDDSPIVCAALKRLLERDPEIHVVATALDAQSALRAVSVHEPDIATVDLNMPGRDGVDFIGELMHARPTPVLVVTADAKQPDAFEALRSGALDVVGKPTVFGSEAGEEFCNRVKRLAGTPVIRRV